MEKIDFVVTWVDGNDENWKKEKSRFENKINKNIDESEERYRDWEIMKYWFRAVEKNTPWVNKIFFITWGHIPKWLNVNNPKLVIIKHEDYIPTRFLPTFNSNVIELNLNRIKELSENFVLFNDDMFILKNMKEKEFFINGIPRDSFAENAITTNKEEDIFPHILLNNMGIINEKFCKKNVYKKNLFKYINPKYGLKNLRTIGLLGWSNFSLIYDNHIPVALCKSTLNQVWNENESILENTSMNRFRSITDINQYVFRYYQMLSGNFKPRSFKVGRRLTLTDNNEKIYSIIKQRKYKMVCLNDGKISNFDKTKKELIDAFEYAFNEKSSFEI